VYGERWTALLAVEITHPNWFKPKLISLIPPEAKTEYIPVVFYAIPIDIGNIADSIHGIQEFQ